MGEPSVDLSSRDYAYLATMHETLEFVIRFAELAQEAGTPLQMGVYLKMAARSMTCALQMYRDKENANVVQGDCGDRR